MTADRIHEHRVVGKETVPVPVSVPLVSILIVLDLGHWHLCWEGRSHRGAVSILVVLDLGHWLGGALGTPGNAAGFNPCCLGSRSLAGFSLTGTRALVLFQSLLSWISVIGAPPMALFATPQSVSILVVLDLGHWPLIFRTTGRSLNCFNPCCLGSRSLARVRRPLRTDGPRVSILVVLDLGHWLERGDLPVPTRPSFNPCCLGSRSLACPSLGDRHLQPGVSILVVLDLGHWLAGQGYAGSTMNRFQSLLSWISVIGAGGGVWLG